jgi:outer membrane autotransporter protein
VEAFINNGFISGDIDVGLSNAGTITSLTNEVDGLITGTTYGMYNNNIIETINNSGLIGGTTRGLGNSGRITSLTNEVGGFITGNVYGIDNQSGGVIETISNSGAISSVTHTGLLNSGTITSLTNEVGGFITGDAVGISNQSGGVIETISNSGTISGALAAIYLDGNSTLTNFTNAGIIAGSIDSRISTALTINGGSGTIFGILTDYSGGIGTADIGSIASTSDVIFASGNQLLNSNIVATGFTVSNNAVLQLNNPITITGNYTQSKDATLLLGVSNAPIFNGDMTDTGYGRLVVYGDVTIQTGSTITLKSQGYSFAEGQRYVVISSNGANTNYNESALNYSATGYSVTGSVQTDTNNANYSNLVLTLGTNAPNNHATNSNAASALGGLFNYSGNDAALLAVFNPAAALNSAASANRAGVQLSSAAITGAATKAVDAATQALGNVVTSHLDGIRLASSGDSGIATGERSADIGVWGQVFGGKASQGLRDNVSGFHANYRGLLIGADGLVSDQVRAGGLISATKTSVANDDDNTSSSATVNSYGLTAYATYAGKPWYVNVMAGVMKQEYSTVRNISYPGFAGVAAGSFNGHQYITSVQAGYPLNLDAWLSNTTLTPIAGLSYSTLRQNGYTETGGNGAALAVGAMTSNSLTSELGAKLERIDDISYGKLLTSVQLGWRHEYKDNIFQTGARFVADSTGATTFTTKGASPVSNLGVLNLGVTLVQRGNLSLTGKYTLEAGGGYIAHTGSVQARLQF